MLGLISPISSVSADDDINTNTSINNDDEDDDDDDDDDDEDDEDDDDEDDNRIKYKSEKNNAQKEISEKRKHLKWSVTKNRKEAKKNRKDFKIEHAQEYKNIKETLSEEEKNELETIKDSFKTQAKALRDSLKQVETEEARDEIRDQMNSLREEQFSTVADVLWENAATVMKKRKSIYEENKALREDSRSAMSEYKAHRKEYIDTYKGVFIKKIGNRLDKIPTANLEKAAEKIDAMLEKIENNSAMSEERKQSRLDAVIAIKEIVEDRLENDEGDAEILDIIDELLE